MPTEPHMTAPSPKPTYEQLEAVAGELRDILDDWLSVLGDLLDNEPCRLDHHGHCQAHAWLYEMKCPHARAGELVDAERF